MFLLCAFNEGLKLMLLRKKFHFIMKTCWQRFFIGFSKERVLRETKLSCENCAHLYLLVVSINDKVE